MKPPTDKVLQREFPGYSPEHYSHAGYLTIPDQCPICQRDRYRDERDEARRIAEALLYQTPMEGDLLKAVESWREEQTDE